MKRNIRTIFAVLFSCIGFAYGQTSNCNLYIDNLKLSDTLKITIRFSFNRNEKVERLSIYMDNSNHFQALIDTDTEKDKKIELTKGNILSIRSFEKGVRMQSIKGNTALNIHSLATYEVNYKNGSVSFISKEEFFSLCDALMKK